MPTPTDFVERAIPFSTSWATAKSSSGDSLQYLIDRVAPEGTAERPATVLIDQVTPYPTNGQLVIPKTVVLEQVHDGYIDFAGSTTAKLTIEGRGIKDPNSSKPLFMDAPVNAYEDVTRKGVVFDDDGGNAPLPSSISNELFGFTGSDADSFNKRVKAADEAFRGYPVTIICHPNRKTKGYMVTRANRVFHGLSGEYRNDMTQSAVSQDTTNHIEYIAPFLISENTFFTAEPGAKWFQSSVVGAENGLGFVYPRHYRFGVGESGFYLRGKWGMKDWEIHGDTAQSITGTRAVINSGAMQMHLDGVKFIGTSGYTVTVMSQYDDPAITPYDCVIENCYAEDTWTYIFNVLCGYNSRISNSHAVLRAVRANQPAGDLQVAFTDLEPNRLFDRLIKAIIQNCSIDFPDSMPGGRRYFGQGITIHSPHYATENVTIDGFKQTGKAQSGWGNAWLINGYGVNGLKARNLEFENGYETQPIKLSNSKGVTIESLAMRNSKGLAEFYGCLGTRWRNNTVEDFSASSAYASPTIQEKPGFTPVLVSGDNIYTNRFYWSLGLIYKLYDFQADSLFSVNGVETTLEAVTSPSDEDGVSYIRTGEVDHDYGLATAKTFTNASISGKRINISSHGFYSGQSVLLESDGTAPTPSGTVFDESGRVFIYAPNANEVELANSFADALAGTNTLTLVAGSSSTHRLRPFIAGQVLVSSVNTGTNTITTNKPHGFETGAFVEYGYESDDLDNIAGIYRYNQFDFDSNINRIGVYEVNKVSSTEVQLIEIEGANKGATADLGAMPAVTHWLNLVAKSLAAKAAPALYEVESGTIVNLDEAGSSRIAVPTNLERDAIGILPTVETTSVLTGDAYKTALAKVIERLNVIDPPVWMADRFYHFKASDLVGVVANGATVDLLPNAISGGTFEYSQATANLRGKFYEADENGLPYILLDNNNGYLADENFPDLTAGFSFAVKGAAWSTLNDGYYTSALNNNNSGATSPLDATWNFSFTYGGVLRWWNAGVIADVTRQNTIQLVLGTTGASASKIFKNGTDITEDGTKIAKPTILHLGDPYAQRNLGGGCRIYEIHFWDKELDSTEAAAFNADNAV